jgi:hypothetical protein
MTGSEKHSLWVFTVLKVRYSESDWTATSRGGSGLTIEENKAVYGHLNLHSLVYTPLAMIMQCMSIIRL